MQRVLEVALGALLLLALPEAADGVRLGLAQRRAVSAAAVINGRTAACAVRSKAAHKLRTKEPTHYAASGCWRASSLAKEVRSVEDVSGVEGCFAFCAKTGLGYFGVEDGKKCWCAASFGGTPLPSKACSEPCVESGGPGCGGINAANIYVSYDCSGYKEGLYLTNIVESSARHPASTKVIDVNGPELIYAITGGAAKFLNLDKSEVHGTKYVQGGEVKDGGEQSFTTSTAVTVYLAAEDAHLMPGDFKKTDVTLVFFNGNETVDFVVYAKNFEAGRVAFRFKNSTVAGIFVREIKGPQITDILDVAEGPKTTIVDVSGPVVQYAEDASLGAFQNVGEQHMDGGKYLQGGKFKNKTMGFTTSLAVTVYVAIDGSVAHADAAPEGFLATGAILGLKQGKETVPFHIYVKDFSAGKVRFVMRKPCRAGIFVAERQDDAMLEAREREILLNSYGAFSDQTCGQDKGNVLQIGEATPLKGTLDTCKLACWNGQGAMKCHGFTYEWEKQLCTFHIDVTFGPVIKQNRTDCYWKLL